MDRTPAWIEPGSKLDQTWIKPAWIEPRPVFTGCNYNTVTLRPVTVTVTITCWTFTVTVTVTLRPVTVTVTVT